MTIRDKFEDKVEFNIMYDDDQLELLATDVDGKCVSVYIGEDDAKALKDFLDLYTRHCFNVDLKTNAEEW
jgi:hypothetical protein